MAARSTGEFSGGLTVIYAVARARYTRVVFACLRLFVGRVWLPQ
eukprot:COSAG02_NODE_422_length_22587_cov_10.209089_23_plen_44_part_00